MKKMNHYVKYFLMAMGVVMIVIVLTILISVIIHFVK